MSLRTRSAKTLLVPGALIAAGAIALGATALVGAPTAEAQGASTSIKLDLIARPPVIDGLPGEWPRPLTPLRAIRGAGGADLTAKGGLAYDAKQIYVAVDVTDDKIVADGDRVDLVVGFSGGATQTVSLYPGVPGKAARATTNGKPIAGAKVVEAQRPGGWTLEAQFPWAALDPARLVRVGLRGALTVHDADAGTTADGSASNAASTAWDRLPSLPTTPEQDLNETLVIPKRLGAPSVNLLVNVTGDPSKERVLAYGPYLVVLGPTYRGGREFFWSDQSMQGKTLQIASAEARDLDGDGRDDLLVRKRFTEGKPPVTREVLEVLTFGSGETPNPVLVHEIGSSASGWSVQNDVRWGLDGGKAAVTIAPGTAKGVDEGSWKAPADRPWDPMLLPWGAVESQTYAWTATAFEKTNEKRRAGATPPPRSEGKPTKAPPAPPPPPPGADLPKVYELYRKERGVTGPARFDLVADVAGDPRSERVLLHDRDLVVFGAGYKGGKGYAYSTLPFPAGTAVRTLLTRDATGDGKHELIVRGVLEARASGDGGSNKVERTIELVYQVGPDTIGRVFAAEVGRTMGSNQVTGSIGYTIEKGKGVIILGTGKATGWTQATYPFSQDTGPTGGIEPLLLPWGGNKPVRYTWNGSAFAR